MKFKKMPKIELLAALLGISFLAVYALDPPNVSVSKARHTVYDGADVSVIYSVPDENITLCIGGNNAGNVTYVVVFGDGHAVVFGDVTGISGCGINGTTNLTVDVTHAYNTTGIYHVMVNVFDNTSYAVKNLTVIIIEPLPADLYTFNGSNAVLENTTTTLTAVRSQYYASSYYMYTSCNLTYNEEILWTFSQGNLTAETLISAVITFQGVSTQYVSLLCNNIVSNLNVTLIVEVVRRITDIKLIATDAHETTAPNNIKRLSVKLSLDKPYTFEVSAQQYGLSHDYLVSWDDGSPISSFQRNGSHSNFMVNHTYNSTGFYQPYVSVLDSMGLQTSSLWLGEGSWNVSYSGFYVYDFCETCFELSTVYPSDGKIRSKNNPEMFTFALTIPNTTAADKTPKQVVCSWIDWTGLTSENPSLPLDTDLSTTITHNMSIVYNPDSVNQSVTVNCSTPLSTHIMNQTVQFDKPLEQIILKSNLADGLRVVKNTTATFTIEFIGGHSDISYGIQFGEESVIVAHCCERTFREISFNHTFTSAGLTVVTAQASDAGNNTSEMSMTVLVINPVSGLSLGAVNHSQAENITLVYPESLVTFNISITDEPGLSNIPNNVTCIGSSPLGTVEVGDMSLPPSGSVLMSGEFPFSAIESKAEINCTNELTYQILESNVIIMKSLDSVSIAKENTDVCYSTGDLVVFDVFITGGNTKTSVTVNYGDGKHYNGIFQPILNFTTNHTYTEPGHFQVYVEAKDDYRRIVYNLTTLVTVLRPINNSLTLDGPLFLLNPSGLNGTYVANLLPQFLVPSDVTCTYIFPHQNVSYVISSIDTWLNHTGASNVFVFEDGQDQIVDLSCQNKFSYFTDQLTVHINRSLEDLTLSIAPADNQTAFTSQGTEVLYINCDSKPCYVPNNNIVLEVTALYGDVPLKYDFHDQNLAPKFMSSHDNFTFIKNLYKAPDGELVLNISAEEYTAGITYTASEAVIVQLSVGVIESGAVNGPNLILVPFTYQYTVTLSSVEALATKAKCVWTSPSGKYVNFLDVKGSNQIIQHDGTGFPVSMPFYPDQGKFQTISVNCSNKVSYVVHNKTIETIRGISDVTLSLDTPWKENHCQASYNCIFNVTALYGEGTNNYTVYVDDSVIYTDTKTPHVNFTFPHTFVIPGVYNMSITAADSIGNTTFGPLLIYIQQKIASVQLSTTNTPGTIPDGRVHYKLTHTSASSNYRSTNVTCNYNFPGNAKRNIGLVFNIHNEIYHFETLPSDTPAGLLTANITCENDVSSAFSSTEFYMMEKIDGLKLTADKTAVGKNEIVVFTIERLKGTNVTYTISYMDSTQDDTLFTGDDKAPVTTNHSFAAEGVYNVTVQASNIAETVQQKLELVDHVEVQTVLKDLTLLAAPGVGSEFVHPFQSPNAEFKIMPDPINGIPLTVFFDWNFGGNDVLLGDIPSAWTAGHAKQHTYSSSIAGQIAVKVRAYNNISELPLEVNITLVEVINGLDVTPSHTYAKPLELVTFTLQVTTGSHVNYSIDFGDSNSSLSEFGTSILFMPNVKNQNQVFTHRYNSMGNYTFQVKAWNLYSNANLAKEIVIQNEIPEFVLSSLGPALTPPGLMNIDLKKKLDGTTFIPNDMTCTWSYSDGTPDDVREFSTTWTSSITQPPSQYTPTRHNIQNVTTLSLSCRNQVTPVPKSSTTNISITPNPIELANITNDSPKVYNESITWILRIHNYGDNPCFLWTFTNTSFKVLFGRVECKTKPIFSSYNTFVEVSSPATSLNYSIAFDRFPNSGKLGDIVQLVVYAENSISDHSLSQLGIVTKDRCDPPKTSVGSEGLTLVTTRVAYLSKTLSVYGSSSTICAYQYFFILTWTIHEYDVKLQRLGRLDILPGSVITNKGDLNLMPRLLPLGQYYVELKSIMKGLPIDIQTEAGLFLQIVRTPLHVQISGTLQTLVSTTGNSHDVDAWTLSYDPDLGNTSNKDGMSWKWHCEKMASASESYDNSKINWTLITAYDSGDCGIPTSSVLKPGILRLKPSELGIGQIYAVTTFISKPDGRAGTYTQIITAASNDVMEFKFSCLYNCLAYVNDQAEFKLKAKCKTCATGETVQFLWEYQILNSANKFVPVSLKKNVTTPQVGYESVLIAPPYSFEQLKTYRLRINGTSSSGALGLAVYEIKINKPPYGGNCKLNYEKGQVMLTKFSMTCNQWKDDEETNLIIKANKRKRRAISFVNAPNLNYRIILNGTYIKQPPSIILSNTRDPQSPSLYLPIGDASQNYTVHTYIVVSDSFGSSTTYLLGPENVPTQNTTMLEFLAGISRAANAGDIQTTLQMVYVVRSLIDIGSIQDNINVTKSEMDLLYGEANPAAPSGNEVNIKDYMLSQVNKLKPQFPSELQQINTILRLFMADMSSMTGTAYVRKTMTLINSIMPFLKDLSHLMSKNELHEVVNDIMFSVGQLLYNLYTETTNNLTSSCSVTACNATIEQTTQNNKPLIDIANNIFDTMNEVLLSRAIPGEDPIEIDTPELVMVSQKVSKSMLENKTLSSRLGSLHLPRNQSIYDGFTTNCMDLNYVTFNHNPYKWSVDSIALNQPSQQLRIRDCNTRELLIPENTTQSLFSGTTYLRDAPAQVKNNETILTDIKTQLAFHTIGVIDTQSYAQVFFEINNNVKDISLSLYIKYDAKPNVNDYGFKTVLPRGMTDTIPTDRNIRMELLSNATNNFTTNIYSFVIPKSVTSRLGPYTIGVLVTAFDEFGNAMTEANYTFSVQFITCKLWFENLNKWVDQDCLVTNSSNMVAIKFVSSIFPSSFGAGFNVGPNTIDFGTVFQDGWKKLLENIHVLVVIIIFFLLYVAVLPFAYKYDRTDIVNWTPIPVLGFVPHHKYHYTVDIFTGFHSKAGTDSNVYFALVGTESETKPTFVTHEERKNFQRGSMNRFIVSSNRSIGMLRFLCIGHDCSGKGDKQDWYLEKIKVKDETAGKYYCFVADKWLSLTRGKESVETTLKLVSKYELLEFKGMIKKRATKAVLEDNLWVSTFFRREEDHFTRVQRVTAAISLVFLTMVSNAMWYQRGDPNSAPPVGFQIGPFSFTLQTLIVSVYSILTILPATLLILLFFTKSKPRKLNNQYMISRDKEQSKKNKDKGSKQSLVNDEDDFINLNTNNSNNNSEVESKSKKKKGISETLSDKFLPFWCVYIGWLLCLASMIVCPFFTILYSFSWGGVESAQWLSAFCLSFFQAEGLIGPIKALLLALIISVICKTPVDKTDDFGDEYQDYEFTEDQNDALAAQQLEKIRYRRWLQNELHKAIKMFVWHALFLLCLTFVTIGNRDPNSFLLNNEMRNLYFTEAQEIRSQADFWTYMKETAMPKTYWLSRDNGATVNKLETNFIKNGLSRRLGAPIIRQFRVMDVPCSSPYGDLKHLKCFLDYSTSVEDKRDFLQKWRYPNVNNTLPVQPVGVQRAFMHDNGDATNYDYNGYYATYHGRGYSIPLGASVQESNNIINELIKERWLDKFSRAVVMEFNTYNANVNLFNLLTILVEFPCQGSALIRQEMRAIKLYRYIGGQGVFALISELIIVIFVIGLAIKLIYNIVKEKCKFFKQVVNLLEITKVCSGLLGIAMYLLRTFMIQQLITRMMNNQNEYTNFRGLALVDLLLVFSFGLAMFIQILQVMWIFKFSRMLSIFGGTLRFSVSDLSGFFIAITVVFIGFSIVHYVFYGPLLWDYRDYLHTTYSMVTSMLGKFRTSEFETGAGMFGRVIFVSYTWTMIFIYINLLIVIITDVYEDVRVGRFGLVDKASKAVDLLIENIANHN